MIPFPTSLPRLLLAVGLLAIGLLAALPWASRLGAQVPDSLQVPDTLLIQVPDSLPVQAPDTAGTGGEGRPQRVSPRGAFIRSAVIPGWGHAEVGAHVRGAFYFAAEAASALMIFKTQTRISRVDDQLGVREAVVTARLERDGITDPLEIETALAQDSVVEDLTALRESRAEQREDWIALGIFLLLIGGADAYVSAHLADFPAAVVLEPTPARGVEVGLSVPVGF